MQYPGVALLLYYAIRRGDWPRLLISLACSVLLYPLPDAVLRHYYHQQERWPDAPGPMYLWTSVTPLASLFLFGLLLNALPPGGWPARDGKGKAVAIIGRV
jgi:Na+-transporting methylmalonyl-CoA/oxaloacetate decarboxylase beta subunit